MRPDTKAEEREGYTGIIEWPNRIDTFTVWWHGWTVYFTPSRDEAARVLQRCDEHPVSRFALYQRRKREKDRAAK